MADNGFPDDLFNRPTGKKKSRKKRFLKKYSKQRYLPNMNVPVEYAVIFPIAVLLLIIVAFALGVERGKHLVRTERAATGSEDMTISHDMRNGNVVKSGPGLDGAAKKSPEHKIRDRAAEPAHPQGSEEKQSPAPKKKNTTGASSGKYLIQVASFKQRARAEQEAKKLKERGFDPGMKRSGNWHQVFVRGFSTREEAEKAKQNIEGKYPDCYIRKTR